MTQPKLSKASDVSKATIVFFERGERTPIPATIAALQRALESAGIRFTETGVELAKSQEGG